MQRKKVPIGQKQPKFRINKKTQIESFDLYEEECELNKEITLFSMRTICDVCEGAAAIIFCAADEAALCQSCDDKVHMCNKLASRHVRVQLAAPSAVPRCDICENATAFFYCEVDGTSLCLQCDMIVHVGGKRTHGRYLILRQKVEFPGDKPGQLMNPASQPVGGGENNEGSKNLTRENQQNHGSTPVPVMDSNGDSNDKRDTKRSTLI